MNDILKPKAVCPECGSEKAFFHCTLRDNDGSIYDWGTLVTCLECKTPFTVNPKEMKRIIIIGSRRRNDGLDFLMVEQELLKIYEEGDLLVSGGCPTGGDKFAEDLSAKYNIWMVVWKAEWNRYGKGAGFIRNTIIAQNGDVVVACVAPDRTGGTEDTIKKFKKMMPDGEIILC